MSIKPRVIFVAAAVLLVAGVLQAQIPQMRKQAQDAKAAVGGGGEAKKEAVSQEHKEMARAGGDKLKGEPTTPPVLDTPWGKIDIFPADNPWNLDISKLPVHPKSAIYVNSIGANKPLHPDIGTMYEGKPIGIPFDIVGGDQKKVTIESWEYPDESDKVGYPMADKPRIEGGPDAPLDSDRHMLMIDAQNKKLYELFHVVKTPTGWKAGSGAVWDLTSNKLRPAGWTSADAAGLPIFPGLVRWAEVEAGEIRHAIRFTCRKTQRGYIHPATHWASKSSDPSLPPMGLRLRLKADYDIKDFPAKAQVILKAMKKYGIILADNGGDWFITGAVDPVWNDEMLQSLKKVKGSAFEAVDTGPIVTK